MNNHFFNTEILLLKIKRMYHITRGSMLFSQGASMKDMCFIQLVNIKHAYVTTSLW